MKKLIIACIAFGVLMGFSGCSEGVNRTSKKERLEIEERDYKNNKGEGSVDLEEVPKDYTIAMAKKKGDIINYNDIVYNYDKLKEFMDSFEKGEEHSIRISSATEEGDLIISDLDYDGENIKVKYDTTRDENAEDKGIAHLIFNEIYIEERKDDSCGGAYMDYVLENKESEKSIIILSWFKPDGIDGT